MANGITINSASISPTVFRPGDSVKATFKITNNSASTQNLASVEVVLGIIVGYDDYYFGKPRVVKKTLKPGASATLTATFTIAAASSVFTDSFGETCPNAISYLVSQGTRICTSLRVGMMSIEWSKEGTAGPISLMPSKTVTGTAVAIQYGPRIVDGLRIIRADENGAEDDESEHIAVTTQLAVDTQPPEGTFSCKLHYAANRAATTADNYIDLTASINALQIGVTNDMALVTQIFSAGADWHFLLVYGDAYESASPASASISEAFANLHLSGARTGGVAIGKFSGASEGHPLFECAYPAVFSDSVAMPKNALMKIVRVTHTGTVSTSSATLATTADVNAGEGWTPLCVGGFYASNSAVHPYRLYITSNNQVAISVRYPYYRAFNVI